MGLHLVELYNMGDTLFSSLYAAFSWIVCLVLSLSQYALYILVYFHGECHSKSCKYVQEHSVQTKSCMCTMKTQM